MLALRIAVYVICSISILLAIEDLVFSLYSGRLSSISLNLIFIFILISVYKNGFNKLNSICLLCMSLINLLSLAFSLYIKLVFGSEGVMISRVLYIIDPSYTLVLLPILASLYVIGSIVSLRKLANQSLKGSA